MDGMRCDEMIVLYLACNAACCGHMTGVTVSYHYLFVLQLLQFREWGKLGGEGGEIHRDALCGWMVPWSFVFSQYRC